MIAPSALDIRRRNIHLSTRATQLRSTTKTELILEAFSTIGRSPSISGFVNPSFSRAHWLIILKMTQKADTNEVTVARMRKMTKNTC